MKKHYLSLIFVLLLVLPVVGHSQEQETPATPESSSIVDVSFGAKIKSRHIWNGGLSYNTWSLQPDFTVSIYGFYFNAWALMPPTTVGEVDLSLGYDHEYFSVSIIDFFYPNEAEKFNDFFGFRPSDMGSVHQGWLSASFNGIPKYFPIMIKAGCFVYGDERIKVDNNGAPILDSKGEKQYQNRFSTYLAVAYSHKLRTGQTLSYEVGMTPFAGFFADRAHVVNVKCEITQPIRITDSFTLYTTGELVFNPSREALYFALGIGF